MVVTTVKMWEAFLTSHNFIARMDRNPNCLSRLDFPIPSLRERVDGRSRAGLQTPSWRCPNRWPSLSLPTVEPPPSRPHPCPHLTCSKAMRFPLLQSLLQFILPRRTPRQDPWLINHVFASGAINAIFGGERLGYWKVVGLFAIRFATRGKIELQGSRR